jgi:hypothetical protein
VALSSPTFSRRAALASLFFSPNQTKSVTYTPSAKKTPANSDVKPQSLKIPHQKTNNQRNIKHLQPKNKSVEVGILVSLNSIQ